MQIKGNKKQGRNIEIFRALVNGERNITVGLRHGMCATRATQIGYDIVRELRTFIDAKGIIHPRHGWVASNWRLDLAYWTDILNQYLVELKEVAAKEKPTEASHVSMLGISPRTTSSLAAIDIHTVAQVLHALKDGDGYLLGKDRFGERTLAEIKKCLIAHEFTIPSPEVTKTSHKWLFSRMLAYLDHPEQFSADDVKQMREVIEMYNQ